MIGHVFAVTEFAYVPQGHFDIQGVVTEVELPPEPVHDYEHWSDHGGRVPPFGRRFPDSSHARGRAC